MVHGNKGEDSNVFQKPKREMGCVTKNKIIDLIMGAVCLFIAWIAFMLVHSYLEEYLIGIWETTGRIVK